VLVLGEIRKGVERARQNDSAQARALEKWLQTVADEWGRMCSKRSASVIDSLLAATAKVHRMTLATRNVADVADLGADVFNPFEYRS
jgi:predicted nucleic acid-binding protein